MDMKYVYSNRLVDKSENDLLALEKLLNMSMNLYEQLSCSNCKKRLFYLNNIFHIRGWGVSLYISCAGVPLGL